MSEPVIADKKPCIVSFQAGEYYWCTCGRSAAQPFCDGSHEGTDFAPMQFTVDAPETIALCACKHTNNSPRCDGTHAKL